MVPQNLSNVIHIYDRIHVTIRYDIPPRSTFFEFIFTQTYSTHNNRRKNRDHSIYER